MRRISAGKDSANILAEPGSWSYRLVCAGGSSVASGRVVVRKDASLTAEQVKAYAREYLTGYKHPKYVEFRDELPKTNVGKILRRELRDAQPAH